MSLCVLESTSGAFSSEGESMKDLSETVISLLLAFLGLMLVYSIFGDILSGLITQSFGNLRP
jgi:hypothetical protein